MDPVPHVGLREAEIYEENLPGLSAWWWVANIRRIGWVMGMASAR